MNDAFVANVSVSPNSRTLSVSGWHGGFVKYILWSSRAQESLKTKHPTDAEYESWLPDLFPLSSPYCIFW